ncbi:hypothetical protein [Deltalipothrixvirus pozzuoliense]|uniref:Uncharacterized protein ORF142 n=1 Tax=Acidianus filamentous virus 2 (isolate Italy/Pozzuoli) TaxID=654910 RepID=Y142_AFV2P|nr:hypothetical protein AFV2_gp09 [Acidianus filamentous virus 2]Q573G0.1 RecName: Full=Uncharacterized protein ORF142 [Acidianus filamentous virus 2 (isolate Pozzuoli)]CAH69396.1 hypothetical protein [Acidianus filamentous virus 2]
MSLPKKKKPEVEEEEKPEEEEEKEEEQEIDINNLEWQNIATSNAFKVDIGDEIIFKPTSEPKQVKSGSAFVVDAYVYQWKSQNQVPQKGNATLYIQTVLGNAIIRAVQQYGLGNFVVHAKNKGRAKGKLYYDYEIKIAKVKQ